MQSEPQSSSGKVLVLDRELRFVLATDRSLGRRGIGVHIGWHDDDSPALRSKYVDETQRIPAFSPGSEGWKKQLLEILRREDYDLVIPCDDTEIIPLQ